MKKKLLGILRNNRQGLALITVLGVVTLATILILALFTVSDAEFKSSRSYADGALARQLADNAVHLVMGQVQAAAVGEGVGPTGTATPGTTIWASQPGAVRVYDANGTFKLGRRLYSDAAMVALGGSTAEESKFSNAAPPTTWDQMPSAYTDLNAPVFRTPPGGLVAQAYFPIVDPIAALAQGGVGAIEGFSYSKKTNGIIPKDINGVVEATGGAAQDTLRVPMPVQWLYQLQDGTLGTVNQPPGSSGVPTPAQWTAVSGSSTPTQQNPIVGRMAFWTDDESCMVNVNTAGEPGPWLAPESFHVLDQNWAEAPPTIYEFQRFPGHPATVALSSVLFPNATQDPASYDGLSFIGGESNTPFRNIKNAIYAFAPRLTTGGSDDGTRVFDVDDFGGTKTADAKTLFDNILKARNKRLFPSVDEMIYAETMLDSKRALNQLNILSGNVVKPALLSRTRFFLTANSKASELNMFGLPRVAMWPVPEASQGPEFRTGYDKAIAITSTLGTYQDRDTNQNTYFFSRKDYASPLADIGKGGAGSAPGLKRNAQLMSYLDTLMGLPMPGSKGASFRDKYRDDQRQILVMIFDYIRTTNLYDSFLDAAYVEKRGKRDIWDDNTANEAARYGARFLANPVQLWTERPQQNSYYTYTPPRFDTIRRVDDIPSNPVPLARKGEFKNETVTSGAYPGHGQVSPIQWEVGGKTYKGLGRFPTISEVAFHFICTADGQSDRGSWEVKRGEQIFRSGGKTAERLNPNEDSKRYMLFPRLRADGTRESRAYWYSNLPPEPSRALMEGQWGCNFAQLGRGTPADPLEHPGVQPENWNYSLDVSSPLAEDEKRIQMAIQIELFVPQLGYTKYAPDFTMVLDGNQLSNLEVQDAGGAWRALFSTTADAIVKSNAAYMGSALGEHTGVNAVSPLGGTYGGRPLMTGRNAIASAPMPKDPNYDDRASNLPEAGIQNYPLVSSFFNIKRANGLSFDSSSNNIKFRSRGNTGLKINLYSSHDYTGREDNKNAIPVQSVNVRFPSGETQETPQPYLVVYSSEKRIIRSANNDENIYNAVNAVRWWSFSTSGAVGRMTGSPQVSQGTITWDLRQAPGSATNQPGTHGRFRGEVSSGVATTGRGEQSVPMGGLIYGYSPAGAYRGVTPPSERIKVDEYNPSRTFPGDENQPLGTYGYMGSDSIRSLMPPHGDYRIVAARQTVDARMWQPHPLWNTKALFAHSLSGSSATSENGADTGAGPNPEPNRDARYPNGFSAAARLVGDSVGPARQSGGVWYPESQVPDTPLTEAHSRISSDRRDFDNGLGNFRDGAYTNKPDDGNLSAAQFWFGTANGGAGAIKKVRNAYFMASELQLPSTNAYFTPNRMIQSPVMFGSLPTGVWGSQPGNTPSANINGVPWRTLLFRPNIADHIGGPSWSTGTEKSDPADHYLLDLFWMPIIEPYMMSESFATAGKINLNQQIAPFSYIKRSTAMHAALKGEYITTYSSNHVDPLLDGGRPNYQNELVYKRYKDASSGRISTRSKQMSPREFWSDSEKMVFHRPIDRRQTVKQLEDRYYFKDVQANAGGLMRTASQVCEIHLPPLNTPAQAALVNQEPDIKNMQASSIQTSMKAFWNYYNITGDNTRERPYANLYQKFTTRSNTYRVHFKVQTIRKARSVAPNVVDETRDAVTAEYRGSALFERYLNFNQALAFPDYARKGETGALFGDGNLESRYHYRVLETKQFAP
jgi:uncharacterized protein (TIGR02600 family)